jgi:hypothetical protein
VLAAGDAIRDRCGAGVISTSNERSRRCRFQIRASIRTLAVRLSSKGMRMAGVWTMLAPAASGRDGPAGLGNAQPDPPEQR